MIITKTINIGLKFFKYYEDLGYIIPKYIDKYGHLRVKKGTKIEVKIEDLPKNSSIKVLVKCDNPNCNTKPKLLSYANYQTSIKKIGKYLCRTCACNTLERCKKLSENHKGKKHSEETKRKMSENNWMNGKSGNLAPNWNPNLTNKERNEKHHIPGLYKWKHEVKKRDNYICQYCDYIGVIKDGIMIAHHLDNFRDFKEQRTDIDNGVTLCKNCHHLFHKNFGNKHTTKKQFNEFIQLKH